MFWVKPICILISVLVLGISDYRRFVKFHLFCIVYYLEYGDIVLFNEKIVSFLILAKCCVNVLGLVGSCTRELV